MNTDVKKAPTSPSVIAKDWSAAVTDKLVLRSPQRHLLKGTETSFRKFIPSSIGHFHGTINNIFCFALAKVLA